MKIILIIIASLALCSCRGTVIVHDHVPPPTRVIYVEPAPVVVYTYWCTGCGCYVPHYHQHPGYVIYYRR